ncbi:putative threonine efflux protein [Sterolibacterium denitrificans]|uniref:Threonine efflux protein n=1 Tax=Sterolibacterium denitrificans TaxID=157592 RepID=A0A7Z7HRB3_9PROT|nr:DUF2784 domain-containing protein [Sterolibacterium denitrificans]SMB22618.1 putative threonine efflux protein [Sterolibacterium denitrificans]
MSPACYQVLANAVLIAHFLFVIGVVGGLVLIVWGGFREWAWVRKLWLRLAHLAGIALVVLESWLGVACPLTSLELWLRELAGQATYSGDFIAYWVRQFMFFTAPSWVFTVCYTAFGVLVLLSWWWFPPRPARLSALQKPPAGS